MKFLPGYRSVLLKFRPSLAHEDDQTRCNKMMKQFLALARKFDGLLVDLGSLSASSQSILCYLPEENAEELLRQILADERFEERTRTHV